jgi:cyanate lyase
MEEIVVSLLPVVVSASTAEAQEYSDMFNKLEKAEEIVTRTLSMHNEGFLSHVPYYRNLVWRANKILPLYRKRTKFQEIILAKFGDGNRVALFQDGEWQFLSGEDAEKKLS